MLEMYCLMKSHITFAWVTCIYILYKHRMYYYVMLCSGVPMHSVVWQYTIYMHLIPVLWLHEKQVNNYVFTWYFQQNILHNVCVFSQWHRYALFLFSHTAIVTVVMIHLPAELVCSTWEDMGLSGCVGVSMNIPLAYSTCVTWQFASCTACCIAHTHHQS